MAFSSDRALGQTVLLRLLDSAQGRPIQVWHFAGQSEITIGRADECDVTIADQQVSRSHAKLVFRDGSWTLVSLGRNGTLVDDRLVGETQLTRTTVFRLGPNGPMLRFEPEQAAAAPTETISTIVPDMLAMLEIDEGRREDSLIPRWHRQIEHHCQPGRVGRQGRQPRRRHRHRHPVARHPRHLPAC
jgi:hypothetical protein